MSNDTSPIRFNPGKSGYYSDDSKTKPTGSSGGKDFGKIMSRSKREGETSDGKKQIKHDEDSEDEIAGEVVFQEEEETEPLSLFSMSKSMTPKKPKPLIVKENKGEPLPDVVDEEEFAGKKDLPPPQEGAQSKTTVSTNSEVFGRDVEAAKKKALPARPFDLLASASREVTSRTKENDQKKVKSSSRFNTEQPDLATVNPMAINTQFDGNISLNTKTEQPLPPVKPIQELINIMVKEAQSIEAEGKTDTTITLKHPPIFEGAQLTITSFDSAKGEFNISFQNLTQAAQQLVSREDNKASLMHALEQKGYHMHILTATTLEERPFFTAEASEARQDRNQDKRDEGRNQDEDET